MTQFSNYDYDIFVVGGGLVGSSLVLALADLPLKLALCDAVAPIQRTVATTDLRSVALSYGSSLILDQLHVWTALTTHATAITQIEVSEQGRFNKTYLEAQHERVPALGYVVEIPHLNQVLQQQITKLNNLDHYMPWQVTTIVPYADGYQVQISNQTDTKIITTRLLVLAAGAQETVLQQQLGLQRSRYDYQQTAVIANVELARPHAGLALERFTAQGPLALLPLQKNYCALVWTHAKATVAHTLAQSDAEFLAQLQQQLGFRLGAFLQVGKRQAFPLYFNKAQEQVRRGLVLLGNAAHTLHPVAGQGFNLALRDVYALAQTVRQAVQAGADFASISTLLQYLATVKNDQQLIMTYTHALVKTFTSSDRLLQWGRSLGLLAFDLCALAKRQLVLKNMGL